MTQETELLTNSVTCNKETVSPTVAATHAYSRARDTEAQDQSWTLDAYHLSLISRYPCTRETHGWGKGLGGVAECQP